MIKTRKTNSLGKRSKRRMTDDLLTSEANKEALGFGNYSPDVSHLYPKERAALSKKWSVPQKYIQIIDHPCGENTVFIKQDGRYVFYGYI